jgi:transcriptional regulator with XRE-family HTH domain
MGQLAELRDRADLTQMALAARSGVSLRTIQNIEGGALPKIATARRLAAALGVSLDALFPAEEKAS